MRMVKTSVSGDQTHTLGKDFQQHKPALDFESMFEIASSCISMALDFVSMYNNRLACTFTLKVCHVDLVPK